MPSPYQIGAAVLPGSDQVTSSLLLDRGDRDRRHFIQPQQPRQVDRVLPVGLHVAWHCHPGNGSAGGSAHTRTITVAAPAIQADHEHDLERGPNLSRPRQAEGCGFLRRNGLKIKAGWIVTDFKTLSGPRLAKK